jgi:hypothetical protein
MSTDRFMHVSTKRKTAYCDQTCDQHFSGIQLRMGNTMEGTYNHVKACLNTLLKGVNNYRQFAADRQEKVK